MRGYHPVTDLKRKAHKIYDKYVKDGSEFEINMIMNYVEGVRIYWKI